MPSSLPNERSNVVVDIEIKVCVIDLYGHGSQLHSSLEKLKLRSRQIITSRAIKVPIMPLIVNPHLH